MTRIEETYLKNTKERPVACVVRVSIDLGCGLIVPDYAIGKGKTKAEAKRKAYEALPLQ